MRARPLAPIKILTVMALPMILLMLAAVPVAAQSVLFVIDQTQLPFDLGPGARANSPANVKNAPTQPGNSSTNHANSSGASANKPDNPANGPDGVNAIYTVDGDYAGYATQSGAGALNLFSASGRRLAYRPKGGHTKSILSTSGEWCGTVTPAQGGGMAFGLTMSCARRFFAN